MWLLPGDRVFSSGMVCDELEPGCAEPPLNPHARRRAGRRALEVVRVVGDCAAPRVPAGAWVCVDRRLAPAVGDVVVARLRGELTAKVLREDDEGRWLVSLRRRPPVAVGPRAEILGPVITVLRAPGAR